MKKYSFIITMLIFLATPIFDDAMACSIYYTASTGSGVVGCLGVGSGVSMKTYGCNVSGGNQASCQNTAQVGDLFVSGSTIAGATGGWTCTSTLHTDFAASGWQAVSWSSYISYSTGSECVPKADASCNVVADTSSCRCAAGYYGTSTSCTKCPCGTSSAGSTALSACSIQVGAACGTVTSPGTCAYNSSCACVGTCPSGSSSDTTGTYSYSTSGACV